MGINNQQYRVIIGTFNPAGCRYISGRHCNNIYNDFNAFALIMYLFIFHLCTLSDKSYCRNGQSQGHIQAKDSHGQVGNVCFAVTFFSLVIYYVYILLMMMAMQVDIGRSSDHGQRNSIIFFNLPNNLGTCGPNINIHRKYLNSGFLLLLCIATSKYWRNDSYKQYSRRVRKQVLRNAVIL